MTRYIPIGDVELPLPLIARALGIPAATLEHLASGEWVAVPRNEAEDCGQCGGSGWIQKQRGAGVWEDWQCPVCDGTGKERLAAAPEPTRHD